MSSLKESMLEHKLRKYTKMSPNVRAKAFRWAARQNIMVIHEIFKKQKEHYFQLSKSKETDKFLLYQSAFYLAMHDIYEAVKDRSTKKRIDCLTDMLDPTSIRAKRVKKQHHARKYEKLLDLRSKIINLKKIEGLSFREMAIYFSTYHRLEVSHTLIRKVYLDLIAEHEKGL